MPTLSIQRSSEYVNRFRDIQILLDGKKIGAVANGGIATFEIPAGTHTVQAKIDWAYSPAVSIEVAEGESCTLHLAGFKGSKWIMPVAITASIAAFLIDKYVHLSLSLFVTIPLVIGMVYILTLGRKKYLSLTHVSPNISPAI